LATYKESYAPSQIEADDQSVIEEEEDDDDLFAQIYKKRRVEKENELEKYLEADIAPHNIKLLDWWKVKFSHISLVIFTYFL
jgi:hypothetical protein